jgi:Flp pilus assembly protein TadG
MRRQLRRFVSDVCGANLVEAAIVTPLLLLLTFGICDFATVFFVHLALESGVTQATRAGVTGSPSGAREASLMAAMRKATPALTIPTNAFAFSHMKPGAATWISGAGGPDDIEKITVNYTWKLMTPVLRPLFPGGEVRIRVESSRKNEWRFE